MTGVQTCALPICLNAEGFPAAFGGGLGNGADHGVQAGTVAAAGNDADFHVRTTITSAFAPIPLPKSNAEISALAKAGQTMSLLPATPTYLAGARRRRKSDEGGTELENLSDGFLQRCRTYGAILLVICLHNLQSPCRTNAQEIFVRVNPSGFRMKEKCKFPTTRVLPARRKQAGQFPGKLCPALKPEQRCAT